MRLMREKAKGDRGEKIACVLLRGKGMEIIETNVRAGDGEIDIVAREGEVIVLCEVKARTRPDVRPAEMVTPAKIRRISRAARIYLAGRGWLDREIRFDVIEIQDLFGQVQAHHIPAAFLFDPGGRR